MRRDILILSKTDTTIGFLSQDSQRIDIAKRRESDKKYITTLPSLAILKSKTRTPKRYRRLIRKASKTTFIFSNSRSFRVVKDERHLLLLNRFGWLYSSSANISGSDIDIEYAKSQADIIIYPIEGIGESSTILKLGRKRVRRVR